MPKISLIQVVGYDSLMVKIPIMGRLTYCLPSGELLSEVLPPLAVNTMIGEAKPSYIHVINFKATP